MWKIFSVGLVYFSLLLIACPCFAAHPLITDDTGTQGRGNFQLELNGQYDWDNQDSEDGSIKCTGGQSAATLTYGIVENVDLILSLPYLWRKAEINEITVYDENGIGDAVLETKLRIFEKKGSVWHLNRE
ncbi:MAG TPA: hypothetical protein VMU29_09100 [Smithella sp.]|nr:hypothetical protein [Smithella sp.]